MVRSDGLVGAAAPNGEALCILGSRSRASRTARRCDGVKGVCVRGLFYAFVRLKVQTGGRRSNLTCHRYLTGDFAP